MELETKLNKLIKKISDGNYPAEDLDDLDKLKKKIADDIGSSDEQEAMALLGYLLKMKYAEVNPEKGIVLIRKVPKIDSLMTMF